MATESGFSNKLAVGRPAHKTLHNLGSSRVGQAVTTKALCEIITGIYIDSYIVSDDQKTVDLFFSMGVSGARVDDVLRLTNGPLKGIELDIIAVSPDEYTVTVLNIYDPEQLYSDMNAMRWVTSKADAEGNLNFSPGPTQFVKDGATALVTEDGDPSLNKPLPTQLYFLKDGVLTAISHDTAIPNLSNSIPVEVIKMPSTDQDILAFTSMDFATTPITTSGWEQLSSGLVNDVKKVQIFMSSGDALVLGLGEPGSIATKMIIIPGGNGLIDLKIPAGTKIHVISFEAALINSGKLLINFIG